MTDEQFDDPLGLGSDEDLPQPPTDDQGVAETEQHTPVSEPEIDAQAPGTEQDGSDSAEPAPEPQEPDMAAQIAEMRKQQNGIYAELRAEREKRQAAEHERKALLGQLAEQAQAEAKAKEAASLPSKDEDPAGYLASVVESRNKEIIERLERVEQTRQTEGQQQAYQQAEQYTANDEARFAQEKTDYYDALNFARSERARLLKATHPDNPDEWVQSMVAQGDRMFALQALQQGASPAQRAYEFAVRMGYKPGGNGNTAQGSGGTSGAHNPAPVGSTTAPATRPKPVATSLSAAHGSAGRSGRKIRSEDFDSLDNQTLNQILDNPNAIMELQEQGFTVI